VPIISIMELNIYLSLILFIFSFIAPFIHQVVFNKQNSESVVILLLKYCLFFNIGCLFLTCGLGQFLYPKSIALEIGWSFSEFQRQLAFSEMSVGLLGLICNLFGYQFWLATSISAIIWLIGSSFSYLYYSIIHNTYMLTASSFVIYWNLFIALWILILLYLYRSEMIKAKLLAKS
jgi:hypothetical protein